MCCRRQILQRIPVFVCFIPTHKGPFFRTPCKVNPLTWDTGNQGHYGKECWAEMLLAHRHHGDSLVLSGILLASYLGSLVECNGSEITSFLQYCLVSRCHGVTGWTGRILFGASLISYCVMRSTLESIQWAGRQSWETWLSYSPCVSFKGSWSPLGVIHGNPTTAKKSLASIQWAGREESY